MSDASPSSSSAALDGGSSTGMGGSGAGPGNLKRLRLSRACDRCRRRKIKCDEGHPCKSCISMNVDCTFDMEPQKSVSRPRRNVAELEARMAALERVLEAIPPSISQAALSQLDLALGDPHTRRKSSSSPALSSSITLPTSTKRSKSMRRPSSSAPAAPASEQFTFRLPSAPAQVVKMVPEKEKEKERREKEGEGEKEKELAERLAGLSISPSYLYLDHEGNPAWAGLTSGLPLIDMLNQKQPSHPPPSPPDPQAGAEWESEDGGEEGDGERGKREEEYFPGREAKAPGLEPSLVWEKVVSIVPVDLMNSLIRCYLSTTHLLWPFLHVPTFLRDYATPSSWGEPGFALLVVAICALASRHVDDPRVRANPTDPASSGKHYFELFKRLRDLPAGHGSNVYHIQGIFLGAIFAIGTGKLARAFALFAESITLCIDAGLHRYIEHYDFTDRIWLEVRKRTFWSVYCWDKQAGAAFGRPPMIRLRDCDLREPLDVDDEYLTATATPVAPSNPPDKPSRIRPFIHSIRLHVVLERVLDGCNPPPVFPTSAFLTRAAATGQSGALEAAEALLAEWRDQLPNDLKYTPETSASEDAFRVTQAERLHCLEQLTRMLVQRHRFSTAALAAHDDPLNGPATEAAERHKHEAQQAALTIIAAHSHIARRGLLTHYGVHVIHQLTQAGRTLVAVVLQCRRTEDRSMMAISLEGLRVAIGLLRQFAVRYGCGARSSDVLVEFCRVCHIPVDDTAHLPSIGQAWLRPVPRKADAQRARRRNTVRSDSRSSHASGSPSASISAPLAPPPVPPAPAPSHWQQQQPQQYGTTATAATPSDASGGGSPQALFDPSMFSPYLATSTVSPVAAAVGAGDSPPGGGMFNDPLPPADSAADILALLNRGEFDVSALFAGEGMPGAAPDVLDFGALQPPGAETLAGLGGLTFAPDFSNFGGGDGTGGNHQ